jgi:hypothetical protein
MAPQGIWCPHFWLTGRWLLRWMVRSRPHVHCFLVCLSAQYLCIYFLSIFVNCLSERIRHSIVATWMIWLLELMRTLRALFDGRRKMDCCLVLPSLRPFWCQILLLLCLCRYSFWVVWLWSGRMLSRSTCYEDLFQSLCYVESVFEALQQ